MFGNKYFARMSYVLAAMLLLMLMLSMFPFFASIISQNKYDINIMTGKMRHSHRVFGVKVSENVSDTPISLAVSGFYDDISSQGAWRTTATFGLGESVSSHYIYHSAIYQANLYGDIVELLDLSAEEKALFATDILRSWQQAGNDDGVDVILKILSDRIK